MFFVTSVTSGSRVKSATVPAFLRLDALFAQ
jgi:hypothetical protein